MKINRGLSPIIVDQAISSLAADAVNQYYNDEQAKAMGYAMDVAAKSEQRAYRLEQARTSGLETLATDTGEHFRQSGIGLKPYVKPYDGDTISAWNSAADRTAALQLARTRAGLESAVGGPTTITALAVTSPALVPVLSSTTGIGGLTGGGFDYLGQYNSTAGFTTGKYRPAQTVVAAITGGLAALYAVSQGLFGNVA